MNSSCTQEQKRDQGNTWPTADRYYIHAISLSSPSLAEVFQAYPSPKSHVTHTYTDGQPKIQPFDMSADHVQHPIVWHPQVFRERETMIILSEQDQDPPSEAFLYICDYLCRKSQYHQLPLWDNRPRDHRSVEYAKGNPLLYYLLVYEGRTGIYKDAYSCT